jgi:hypothetical protein
MIAAVPNERLRDHDGLSTFSMQENASSLMAMPEHKEFTEQPNGTKEGGTN